MDIQKLFFTTPTMMHELMFTWGSRLAGNGSRLCAGGDLKNGTSNLVLKPIRITDVQFSTSAPLAQNRC